MQPFAKVPAHSVNQELLLLYFDIGFELHMSTQREAWGSFAFVGQQSAVDDLLRDPAVDQSTFGLRRPEGFNSAT